MPSGLNTRTREQPRGPEYLQPYQTRRCGSIYDRTGYQKMRSRQESSASFVLLLVLSFTPYRNGSKYINPRCNLIRIRSDAPDLISHTLSLTLRMKDY